MSCNLELRIEQSRATASPFTKEGGEREHKNKKTLAREEGRVVCYLSWMWASQITTNKIKPMIKDSKDSCVKTAFAEIPGTRSYAQRMGL